MGAQEPLRKIERPLRDWEIAEAKLVFRDTLDYASVRVHEGTSWPDAANQLGIWLKRISPPPTYTPNAITIGNHCYFPANLPETQAEWSQWKYTFGWLIHELTHVWQFQHQGWGYLYRALAAQFRLGTHAYDFGGAVNLIKVSQDGKTLSFFNPEQQGKIAQTFYDCLRGNCDETTDRNVAAWLPFINELQRKT